MSTNESGKMDFKNRMAKCRAKKKSDDATWAQFLEKERERKRLSRKKEKENLPPSLKEAKRKTEAKRLALYRKKKKLEKQKEKDNSPSNALGSYTCKNTLGKAVSKTRKSLPDSDSKKKAVLRALNKESFTSKKDIFGAKVEIKPKKQVSEKLITLVGQFYHRDDISYQMPGKADFIKVTDPVTFESFNLQKRYLVMKIDEAKAIFDLTYKEPEFQISRSKFYDLRPDNVFPISQTPHNVCVCVDHATFSFLVESSKKYLVEIDSYKDLLKKMCCDENREECMTNACQLCSYDVKEFLVENADLNKLVKCQKWEKIDGRFQKITVTSTLKSVLNELNDKLKHFKMHSFVKKKQSQAFEKKKRDLTKGQAVLQVDFSENFEVQAQDEIQSAHWCHSQVALFTACIWFEDQVRSYAVVSDDTSHSKECVWVSMKCIFEYFKRVVYPDLTEVFTFSDNCSGQFKSKYTCVNMCNWENDLRLDNFEWNTFAPGHGKGAVDAIGGTVKRNVWNKIKSRSANINNAKEFYDLAVETSKTIGIFFASKDDIKATAKMLNGRWDKAKYVPGIRKFFYFKKVNNKSILCGLTEDSELKTFQAIK